MLTDEERRLSDWLEQVTPQPPRAIVVDDVADRVAAESPARRRHVLPMLAAAAVVVLVAALTVGLRSGQNHAVPDHSAPPAQTPSNPAPTLSLATPTLSPTQATPTHSSAPFSTTPMSTTPGLTTSNTPAPKPHHHALPVPARAWHTSRLGNLGNLEQGTLTALDGRLYAATRGRASDLVRLDPRTGKVLARSQVALWAGVIAPAVSGGLVWDVGADSRTVVGFDPTTLRETVSYPIGVTAADNVEPALAPDSSSGGVIFGYARTIAFVTAQGVQSTLTADQDVYGLALSPDGSRLYVATLSEHAAPSLETLDPSTGAELAQPFRGNTMSGLVATAGGVWYLWGSGMSAGILFTRTDGTQVPPVISHGQRDVDVGGSGGGFWAPPTVNGGVAWLGGDREIGCADPDTGTIRASTAVGTRFGDVIGNVSSPTLIGHTLFAVFDDLNANRTVLITMRPPAACFTDSAH